MIGRVINWLFRPRGHREARQMEAEHREQMADELGRANLKIESAEQQLRHVGVSLLQMRKALYDVDAMGYGDGGHVERRPDTGNAPHGT